MHTVAPTLALTLLLTVLCPAPRTWGRSREQRRLGCLKLAQKKNMSQATRRPHSRLKCQR